MMAQYESTVTVIEHCRVSPPEELLPQQPPTLIFFDIPWVVSSPVQRVFFYSYHHDKIHFINTTLPIIKRSLSLTLQHFHPLLGIITWPPESIKPEIQMENNSGVMLTVAECDLDFNHIVANHPRDVNEFFPLVPQLPSTETQVDVKVPPMALQVTLFPNTGISIGISSLHVIGDGRTTTDFIKSWASVCKSGLDDTSCLPPESLPYYDRSSIDDPNHLETLYLNELAAFKISHKNFCKQHNRENEIDKVRATFVLGRPEIQKMKRWVLDRIHKMYYDKDVMTPTLSSFVLTMAYMWVCLVKVMKVDEDVTGMEMEHSSFVVDCRERLNPPLPTTYFGNCLMACFVDEKRNDLMGEDGIAIAAMAIGNAIQKMITEGVLVGAEDLFPKFKSLVTQGWFISVAGSPKLGVYDSDFGWGKPQKVEVISIDTTNPGSISLSEYVGREGGLEIGLVLHKVQMDGFATVFKNSLNFFRDPCTHSLGI